MCEYLRSFRAILKKRTEIGRGKMTEGHMVGKEDEKNECKGVKGRDII